MTKSKTKERSRCRVQRVVRPLVFCKKCCASECMCAEIAAMPLSPYKTLKTGELMKVGDESYGWRPILPTSVGKKVRPHADGFVRRRRKRSNAELSHPATENPNQNI